MNIYVKELLETLKEVISYKTVLAEAEENAPFGKENRKCLDHVLNLGENLGFVSKDVDGYAGHIEWKGTSDKIVGVLGHLDVVPAGDGWETDPFTLTTVNGELRARGIMDDKGPILACLYAMKQLKDEGFVPTKSIRIIMGCNEENGSSCVKHYFTKEAMPDVGFSPDGEFPVIHCEMGITWAKATFPNTLKEFNNFACGAKTNMVPAKATCDYLGDLSADFFEERGLTTERDNSTLALKITALGKSAHGSTPQKGENAIWTLLSVINEVEKNEYISFMLEKLTDHDGTKDGIGCENVKSGKLSQNLATLNSVSSNLEFTIDIRYPTATTFEKIYQTLSEISPEGMEFTSLNHQHALYIDPESELVTSLMDIHKKHTGIDAKSLIIGGGTYARELKLGVAFGPLFMGDEATIHMPNERVSVENFEKMYDIYYDTIKQLASK